MKKVVYTIITYILLIQFICLIIFSNNVLAIFNNNTVSDEKNNHTVCSSLEMSNESIVSLYVWDIGEVNLSKLKDEVEYLKINTLYIQRPSSVLQSERLKQIMEFAKIYSIDVFLLDGAIDWLTTGDINNAKALINQANKINETLDYKLKGVSLDVEFHIANDYEDLSYDERLDLYRTFTAKTKECCDYANSLGLGYSMALPVWYDKLVGDELENLINYNYDHIAFMNYYKKTILENLDEEVEYARKHNIKIVSIAEVQNPKNGNVGEEDSFYNDGLDACIDTLNKIKDKYNYENLGTSYHYYKPLLDLLKRDTNIGIENKYELEVYPYENEHSIKVNEATISSDGITFEPIYGYYSESGEYVLNFYGLEYGKEYTLTAKSGLLTSTKTFTYEKDNERIGELEIAYTDMQFMESQNPDENTPDKDNSNTNDSDKNNPDNDGSNTNDSDKDNTDNDGSNTNDSDKDNTDNNNSNTNNSDKDNIDNDSLNTNNSEKDNGSKEEIITNTHKVDINKDNTILTSNLPKAGDSNYTWLIFIGGILIIVNIYYIIKIKKAMNE